MNYCSTLHNAQLCKETLTTIGPSSEIETSEEKKKAEIFKIHVRMNQKQLHSFFFFDPFLSFGYVKESEIKQKLLCQRSNFRPFCLLPQKLLLQRVQDQRVEKYFLKYRWGETQVTNTGWQFDKDVSGFICVRVKEKENVGVYRTRLVHLESHY